MWRCAGKYILFTGYTTFNGKIVLGTKLCPVMLDIILKVWKIRTNMSSGLSLKFTFMFSLRKDYEVTCDYFV